MNENRHCAEIYKVLKAATTLVILCALLASCNTIGKLLRKPGDPPPSAHVDTQKGSINLHLSLPQVNTFVLQPDDYGRQSSIGYLGVIGGLDYHYMDNRSVSIAGGVATDFPFPIPAPFDRFHPYESVSSVFYTATHNHHIKRFTFGYGVSFSRNRWGIYNGMGTADSIDHIIAKRVSYSAGLSVISNYRVWRNFHVGFIYRPSFIRFQEKERFKYEHLLALELAWRIRLRK